MSHDGGATSAVPGRWAIWRESRATVAVVLGVDLLALMLAVLVVVAPPGLLQNAAGPWTPEPGFAPVVAAALLAGAVGHQEMTRLAERLRRVVLPAKAVDFTSTWTFAAALAVPPRWSVAVVAAVYLHLWWRSWRPRVPLYRATLNAASVILAVASAAVVVAAVRTTGVLGDGAAGPLGAVVQIVVAMVVYTVVQYVVVTAVVAVASRRVPGHRFSAEEKLIETATLCQGALTAAVVVWQPFLVVFVPLPLVVLGRAMLVRELREALDRDARTGLLTAQAWESRTERLLERDRQRRRRRADVDRPPAGATRRRRGGAPRAPGGAARRVVGVLMVDVDHFKSVNDRFGHAAGDAVLRDVAGALRAAVRTDDLVARYGGEEFLILIVERPAAADDGGAPAVVGPEIAVVERLAERVRSTVADLVVSTSTPDGPVTLPGVTVSVGAVALTGPAAARDPALTEIVGAADAAVYDAKRSGRNCVRMGRMRSATTGS